jgi:hypothetical protein
METNTFQAKSDNVATENKDTTPRDVSRLVIYSVGTVAANKELNSREIEVVDEEHSSMLDGKINDNVSSLEVKGTKSDGSSYESKQNATASIRAQWLPIGSSNRVTPPDVRRGEKVAIWKFADKDEYFWCTLKDDLQLRKLETAIYAWSNTRNEGDTCTGATTYFFEVSTHTKKVTFHTSNNDGEACSYDIQINTGEGYFAFVDSLGNVIRVDSKASSLLLQSAEGAYINLAGKNLTIDLSGGNYTLLAGNINEQGNRTLQGDTNNIGKTSTKGLYSSGGGGGGAAAVFDGSVSSTGVMHSDTSVTSGGDITATGEVHGSNI